MEIKQQIRKKHLLMRNMISDKEAAEFSEKICGHLKNFFVQKEDLAERGVYGYYPYGKEVSLLEIYKWLLKKNIPLAFPRTEKNTMDFYLVSSMEEFLEGAFHIMEPLQKCKKADLKKAFCLVPGSVFDYRGNRYGYGKGYYDRYFFVHKEIYRIGIAYENQMEHEIFAEEHDIKMQAAATEQKIYFFEMEDSYGISRNL